MISWGGLPEFLPGSRNGIFTVGPVTHLLFTGLRNRFRNESSTAAHWPVNASTQELDNESATKAMVDLFSSHIGCGLASSRTSVTRLTGSGPPDQSWDSWMRQGFPFPVARHVLPVKRKLLPVKRNFPTSRATERPCSATAIAIKSLWTSRPA